MSNKIKRMRWSAIFFLAAKVNFCVAILIGLIALAIGLPTSQYLIAIFYLLSSLVFRQIALSEERREQRNNERRSE